MTNGKTEPSKEIAEAMPERWRSAIDAIITGRSDADAAEAAGVSRQTLNGWKNHNAVFIAELNQRRAEMKDVLYSRIASMLEEMTACLAAALKNPETPPAVIVQAGLSALPKLYALVADRNSGETDVFKIIHQRESAEALSEVFDRPSLDIATIKKRKQSALKELRQRTLFDDDDI
jgi:site-specific recombinase XerD